MNIHLKFGCKRPSIRKVVVFYSTTYWTQISLLLAIHNNS